jgi:prolipoprotein diacylglyceryl transferase
MSFIGGILGVVSSVGILFWIKKLTWKDFLTLFDVILLVVPLGIFLGRFGNFLNQELYGIPVEDLPVWLGQIFRTFHLVHVYPKVDQILRVNTNFLSMIFEGIMIFVAQALVFVRQIKKKERKV